MEEPQEERKCRKKAKSFKRRLDSGSGPKELRRKLTYYLPAPTREAMYAKIAELGVKKREFIISCLKSYFSERKLRVWMPISTVTFKERSFMFDEIPNDLWLRVDEASRDRDYKRVLNHYHVVEAALVHALDLHDHPIYKTHKELVEEQKRKLNPPPPKKKPGRPRKTEE